MKKKLLFTNLLIFFIIIISRGNINAQSNSGSDFGSAWTLLEFKGQSEMKKVDIDYKYKKYGEPYYIYRYNAYLLEPNIGNSKFVALEMLLTVNPQNIKETRFRNTHYIISTSCDEGKYYKGEPFSENRSTSYTNTIGADLGASVENGSAGASVNFSLSRSSTRSQLDMEFYSTVEPINKNDSYARRFAAHYEYYKPTRNDINALNYSQELPYLVIFEIPSNLNNVRLDYYIYAGFTYDGGTNKYYQREDSYTFTLNLN